MRVVIIGAGLGGLAAGVRLQGLGAEVTVLEALPGFLAACDEAVSKEAWKVFTKQGLKIHLGVRIGDVKASRKGVSIAWTDAKGAKVSVHVYDQDGNLVDGQTAEKADGAAHFAEVDVRPESTGSYYLIVKVEQSPEKSTAWQMAYAYK